MAREPEHPGNLNSPDTRTTGGRDGGKTPLLGRRSYLKLTGTAAASAVASAGVAGASGDYDVITVGAGQTFTKRLSQGETWENVLIDITARGAKYRITATTDNWTIRNVGIRGKLDSTPGNQNFVVMVPSSGARGVIENVYLPGTSYARSASPFPSGIFVHANHAGDLEVRNFYAADLPSHGIYGSPPGNPQTGGKGGTVRIHDSYASDTENSGFRIGSNGSYVDNCVAFRNVRGLWSRWANTEARSCDFGQNNTDIVVGQSGYSRSSTVTLDGSTCFGTVREPNGSLNGTSAGAPSERVPESCPRTAEEAASGGRSTDLEELPENTLTITGKGEATNYYVETTGEITRNPERGTLQSYDTIDGTSASGWVTTTSNVDGFRFDGELVDVGFEQGEATVEVNGERIDPGAYPLEDELDSVLLVDGLGTTGGTRYEFAVSGAIEKSTEKGASIDDEDTIDSGTVTGSVGGWRDAFRFSGDLEELTVDGGARVYVDDERVDPADYGEEMPHVLTIVGNGSPASYEASVDGTIEPVAGEESDDATVVSKNAVEGTIERGTQRFRFSGVISDFTFIDGSAHVYVDDERIDPDEIGEAELLPHAVVIDGTGGDGVSEYSFEIDGDVIASSYRDATVDDSDAIEGTAVSGTVAGGLDAYWFDGDIVDFRLDGDATVDVEYDVRSQ